MRKIVIFWLLFALLCPCASAAAEKPKYIALTFEGFPAGKGGRELLDALAARDAHATFFLPADALADSPGLGEMLTGGGHEVGLSIPACRDLSRRTIAREIAEFRGRVPGKSRVRFLRLTGDSCSDGLRQVAEVMGLSFLDWSLDPEAPAPNGLTLPDRAGSGAVLRLRVTENSDLPGVLELLDRLEDRGFILVTASDLARRMDTMPRPGCRYRDFSGMIL